MCWTWLCISYELEYCAFMFNVIINTLKRFMQKIYYIFNYFSIFITFIKYVTKPTNSQPSPDHIKFYATSRRFYQFRLTAEPAGRVDYVNLGWARGSIVQCTHVAVHWHLFAISWKCLVRQSARKKKWVAVPVIVRSAVPYNRMSWLQTWVRSSKLTWVFTGHESLWPGQQRFISTE